MRSSPAPVSMFLVGRSATGSMSASQSFCMNTRFQNSTYRSSLSIGPRSEAGAERLAAVDMDLGARTAGPRDAHVPEVVLSSEPQNTLGSNTHLIHPDLFRLVVGLVDGEPELFGVHPPALGDQFPRPRADLGLVVVAEAEVAQHLEEGQVPGGSPDLLEVVVFAARADALLHAHGPLERRSLLAAKVRLELVHPRVGEQQRGIVRDQRR